MTKSLPVYSELACDVSLSKLIFSYCPSDVTKTANIISNKCVSKTQYPQSGSGQISDWGIPWGQCPGDGE